jgi:hypothetical protein
MNQPIRETWSRVAPLAVSIAVASSCNLSSLAYDNRPIPNDVEQVPVLREAVVPTLLPLITAAGLFQFPAPNVAIGEMPFDTAVVQAGEFLDYAQNIMSLRGAAEDDHGALIEMGKLDPCRRAHLGPSQYEPAPDSVTPSIQTQLGRRWLIPFCGERRTPEVVVSVATRGNLVRYSGGSRIGTADDALAFRVRGIWWEWKAEHLVTAEEAVNEVFAVTGARAARLPELASSEQINGRPVSSYPACVVWRVTLERPVRMAAWFTLRRLDLTEVFVASSDCPSVVGSAVVLTPMPDQPTTREIRVSVRDTLSTTGFRNAVYLARLRAPVTFESVVIER